MSESAATLNPIATAAFGVLAVTVGGVPQRFIARTRSGRSNLVLVKEIASSPLRGSSR